ncbi:MAG: recombination protein RecR [Candidatus Dependentiae bacterium]|nr:recombination protein RecR [Candidatus Dependentiae bacterium]
MIHQLPTLQGVVKQLQQVPFLASKNLYRVLSHFLEMDPAKLDAFCAALQAAKKNLIPCSRCFVWQEKNQPCLFCDNEKRDKSIICVIESWQELLAIERTEGYKGLYHVLGGNICPLDGIGPEDLTIAQLITRIDDSAKEIILAMNQTPEGEATSAYIVQKLATKNVKVTCLAKGVPVGSSLEFIDRLTMFKALTERRPF